jgi:S-adenosylmethionine hydrolase
MVIALLTDFGTRDYFVGAMKGVILKIDPAAVIVDISHEIEPYDIEEAGYVLQSCYDEFPNGTIFLTIVDPGVGSDRRPLAIRTKRHFFVGPDNGVFSFLMRSDEIDEIRELTNTRYFRQSIGTTFHGRDIFAPVAANISAGAEFSELGPALDSLSTFDETGKDERSVRIISIDRFGNLVTSLDASDFGPGDALFVNGYRIASKRSHYREADPGELFLIEGSTGKIEVSVNQGSARDILRAEKRSEIVLARNEPPSD